MSPPRESAFFQRIVLNKNFRPLYVFHKVIIGKHNAKQLTHADMLSMLKDYDEAEAEYKAFILKKQQIFW